MEKKLGQDDIDALFAAARTANASTAISKSDDAPSAEKYNFSRAGQISKDQLRAISTVNDMFARNLMHSLGGWLRTTFQVKLVSAEQLPFSEFLERLSALAYVCSMRLDPLGAVGLMEIDLSLATPMVDLLLGGTGRVGQMRELTDIEESILSSVVEMILQELNLAWQSVGLSFGFEKRETEGQVARMLTPAERTLCVSFEVRMPEAQGVLNICLPSVVLNAILRRMVTERERPRRRSKESDERMRELIRAARFGTSLQLPPVRLTSMQLTALTPGVLLRLPLAKHEPAELRVEGKMFARAIPVRSGEHRGALLDGEQPMGTIRVN